MLTTSLPFSCFILSPPIIIIRNGIAKVALIHCHTERSTQNGPQFNQAPDLALALIVLYGKQRGTKHNVPINSFNSLLLKNLWFSQSFAIVTTPVIAVPSMNQNNGYEYQGARAKPM